MFQVQLKPVILRHERMRLVKGVLTSVRQFSVSPVQRDNADQTPGRRDPGAQSSPSRNPLSRLANRASDSRVANSDGPRPRPRVIDARSLGASQNAGQSAKILRGPGFPNARNGPPARTRKPGATGSFRAAKTNSKNFRGRRQKTSRDQSTGNSTSMKAQMDAIYEELEEKTRQTPSFYTPQTCDLSTMKETWPSLPIGVTGRAAGVFEKLSWLSDRYPNGHVPPQELGQRLFRGKKVHFANEEEKTQAVEEAKKLAQQYADKLSQQKGDLVEPKDISFKPINAADRTALIETLVQGNYPKLESQQANKSPVIDEILRNLRNNGSYQTTGKSAQLVQKVQSLLASGRPVKRT